MRGFRIRLVLVNVFFAVVGASIIAKAAYLQIVRHDDLSERAVAQYQKSVYLSPTRGVIHDRRWRQLAANVEAFSVYAEPASVEDKATAAALLSSRLELPSDRIQKTLAGRKGFVWLKRQVNPREAKAVKSLKLPGIGLFTESRRFYPQRDLASQLIGFAGIDSQGLEGVEFSYDRYLRGNAGWLVVQRDAMDRAIFVEGYQSDPQNRGLDLRLNLDQTIQFFAQEEIRRAVEESGAREGIVMVMVPATGEILAMAISSYFNPNSRDGMAEQKWKNICLTNVYEPGSTMKPFVVAAALEERTVTADRVYYCGEGSITLYGKVIKDVHPYADLTVKKIVAKSSNVGAIKVGATLGKEAFFNWLREFGFGRATGIDLPGESKGLLRPPASWSGLSQASLSIGQEIGATPMQMLAAYGVIANDGLFVKPRVAEGVYRQGKAVKMFPAAVARRVISVKTAAGLKDILADVVVDGTGKAAAIPGYSVAGKTGTAQKFDLASGGYAGDKYLSSFIGFAPAMRPAVAILVMIDEPVGAHYGGSVAAPVFAKVGERILAYLAVPHDRPEDLFPIAKDREAPRHEG